MVETLRGQEAHALRAVVTQELAEPGIHNDRWTGDRFVSVRQGVPVFDFESRRVNGHG